MLTWNQSVSSVHRILKYFNLNLSIVTLQFYIFVPKVKYSYIQEKQVTLPQFLYSSHLFCINTVPAFKIKVDSLAPQPHCKQILVGNDFKDFHSPFI